MRKALGTAIVVIGLLAGVLSAPATAVPIGAQASWSSGTLQPLAIQNWVWNNANATLAYAVGFSPVGATSSSECSFEVVHSTYAKRPSGELEFRFTIKNVGIIACGTTILLSWTAATNVGSTANLGPGESQAWVWNNAVAGQAHLVALPPPSSAGGVDCRFEVTRLAYYRQADGEREFRYTVKNVGTASCKATIRIAFLASSISWTSLSVPPNSGIITSKGNSTPLNRIYVPGLEPAGSGCQYDISRTIYSQWLNRGNLQRRYDLWLDNTGTVTCAPKVLLAVLTG